MDNNETYSILIADDHVLLREALTVLISSFDGFHVISTASNGKEVKDIISGGMRPDIVLLDINMPEMDGYETASWLCDNHPDIKVMVLTMYDSEVVLLRLLQVGVRGMLKKNINPQEMRRALVSVMEDGYYYSHATTGRLGTLFRRQQGGVQSIGKAMLTDQEICFLKLAGTEMTYKEVAAEMNLTPRAVDSIRDGLFERLDVKSRVGLAIYAAKSGILKL